jgi:Zn-dependent protease
MAAPVTQSTVGRRRARYGRASGHGGRPLSSRALGRALAIFGKRPLLSVILSVIGFSFFGPLAALVLVATMLDHEFAHRALMRRFGYNPGPVQMVPFVGAMVRARTPMLRSAHIALIYLAGPLSGVLSAAAASLLASWTLSPALCHQVYIGASVSIALNVFNLLPIEPLDGGLVSRVLPYQALLLFPLALGLYLLLYADRAATPLGLAILVGASWITLHKVGKWRRYLGTLRTRVAAGDLGALRELRLSVEVPLMERVLVVAAYVALIPGAIGLLNVLARAGGWLR